MSLSPRVSIIGPRVGRNSGSVYRRFLEELDRNKCNLSQITPTSDYQFPEHEVEAFFPVLYFKSVSGQTIETIDVAVRQSPCFSICKVTAGSEPNDFTKGKEAPARTEALKAVSKAAFKALSGYVSYNALSNARSLDFIEDVLYALRFADFLMIRKGLQTEGLIPDWEEVLKKQILPDFFEDRSNNETITLCFNEFPFGLAGGFRPKVLASIFPANNPFNPS